MEWRWCRARAPDGGRWGQVVVGHGAKFGRKKEDAIAALLSQKNIEDAAPAAKIGSNTLLRWLQLPESRQNTSRRAVKRFINPWRGCSRLLAPLRSPSLSS